MTIRTFKDIYTGKVFTTENNQVSDQFGNVATISAHDWLLMQGSDVLLTHVNGESVQGEELAEVEKTSGVFVSIPVSIAAMLAGISNDASYKECKAAVNACRKVLGKKWKELGSDHNQQCVVVRRMMIEEFQK